MTRVDARPPRAVTADTSGSFDASGNALIIKLAARPDIASLDSMPRGAARKTAAFDALVSTARRSQAPFLAIARDLKDHGMITGFDTLFSPNAIVVNPKPGQENVVRNRFALDGVKAIFDNERGEQVWPAVVQARNGVGLIAGKTKPYWGYDVTKEHGSPSSHARASERRTGRGRFMSWPGFPYDDPVSVEPPSGPTYGVSLVGAPDAWKQGADGRGMVFGSIDSGADYTHPALKPNYRGTTSDGKVTHDYNWMDFDAAASRSPVDGRGHGTHTLGSAVGRAGTAEIGVAPGAKWIAARGTTGEIYDALRAMQWMQAPTRLDGTAPDAAKAPDVVGMSWFMGNPRQELFRESVQDLRMAGIEVVKSAGNQGPDPGTITSPGQFPEIYAIASVDNNGKAAQSSSRGPALIPKGNPTPKPDFAAPGVEVLSSAPGGGYALKSGTSMAQPHASGAILAILSKYPQLTHDQLTQVLAAGATDAGDPGRDSTYGQGIINIPKALDAARALVGDRASKGKRAHAA